MNHLLSAFQAEMIACLQGLQAAINAGVRHIILETDASMVQQAIVTEQYSNSACAGLVEEVQSLVDSNLLSFQCAFNKSRYCNCAAHEVAVLGLCCVEGKEHITCDVPENILVIVADDLSANAN